MNEHVLYWNARSQGTRTHGGHEAFFCRRRLPAGICDSVVAAHGQSAIAPAEDFRCETLRSILTKMKGCGRAPCGQAERMLANVWHSGPATAKEIWIHGWAEETRSWTAANGLPACRGRRYFLPGSEPAKIRGVQGRPWSRRCRTTPLRRWVNVASSLGVACSEILIKKTNYRIHQ
jgi:hypothetical protein